MPVTLATASSTGCSAAPRSQCAARVPRAPVPCTLRQASSARLLAGSSHRRAPGASRLAAGVTIGGQALPPLHAAAPPPPPAQPYGPWQRVLGTAARVTGTAALGVALALASTGAAEAARSGGRMGGSAFGRSAFGAGGSGFGASASTGAWGSGSSLRSGWGAGAMAGSGFGGSRQGLHRSGGPLTGGFGGVAPTGPALTTRTNAFFLSPWGFGECSAFCRAAAAAAPLVVVGLLFFVPHWLPPPASCRLGSGAPRGGPASGQPRRCA